MTAIPLLSDGVFYPESDGQPFDGDLHRDLTAYLIRALGRRYRDEPDVYVTGNLFLYFSKGNPRAVVAPDLFLVKGVPKGRRRIYKLWEEGRVPSLVIELTSDSTPDEDAFKKKDIYERLGVAEYFLFDPYKDYLRPSLQGHRLTDGRYRPIEPEADGSLRSLTTGLLLRREGEMLRLVDGVTGEPLPWEEEVDDEFARERAARRAAEERVRILEEEVARLRRELKRES